MTFKLTNCTGLRDAVLMRWMTESMRGWRVGCPDVRVRYGRGAPYSGRCYYQVCRILINIERSLNYPYRMVTHLARAQSSERSWWKPGYTVELADAYQLVLFIFLHELYHLLIHRAGRNMRQKESMCDRFAARVLVDRFGADVRCDRGRPVPRDVWDFQDLEGFVAAARDRRCRGAGAGELTTEVAGVAHEQMLLFRL